jgi:hypothetical protein
MFTAMKSLAFALYLLFPIISSAQTHPYGEMTGTQWKEFEADAYKWLNTLTTNGQPVKYNESVAKDLAQMNKTNFILGVFELGVTLPSNLFVEVVNKGKKNYMPHGNQVAYLYGASPWQMVKGLDRLYEDYKNTNIKILDGMDIVGKEIHGESEERIEWWTRYYRATPEARMGMWETYPEK